MGGGEVVWKEEQSSSEEAPEIYQVKTVNLL